ncbi:MAG: hypothetical protein AAB225_22420 [Acidobacteriota bacterium]
MRLQSGSAFLCVLQLLTAHLPAQPQGAASGPQGSGLKIVVLEGEGARHSIKTKRAVQARIEVRDEKDRPLPGAQVVFQLPAAGPGGTFPGGRLMQRVAADARGQAATTGLVPNDEAGRFNVKITATSGTASGSAIIAQINAATTELDVKKRSKAPWILLALGAAGVTGGVAATRGGGGSAGPPPPPNAVTLVPGPVTVGGPR